MREGRTGPPRGLAEGCAAGRAAPVPRGWALGITVHERRHGRHRSAILHRRQALREPTGSERVRKSVDELDDTLGSIDDEVRAAGEFDDLSRATADLETGNPFVTQRVHSREGAEVAEIVSGRVPPGALNPERATRIARLVR